ncbi:hypothetical protein [Pseudonocardia hydrocarbonoxydans]|uniref:Uncharacterized protein n=1 Tax=Pseudonocardia hydrocarbonoxydans TaxID=76726 RepID=A0A4Y3WXD5_9PSEU|nr:hypothetical protein [Pseudonocardia hydrocarbonoxydans]GEC22931.1 hypothetical protein PHY01_52140 [Pseudonocardia hydrocarbonoxydans]
MDSALLAAIIAAAVALLAAITSAVATMRVGAIRKGLQVQIAIPRVDAYRALWDLTRPGSVGEPLDGAARRRLDAQMFEWYYTNGNGIFLSNQSRDLLQETQRALARPGEDWSKIADLLGQVRTSLRNDVGVFGTDDIRRRRRQA